MIGNKLELDIIRIFNRDITALLSINQIAHKLKKAYPHINAKVNDLINEGILNKRQIGRSYLCSVNLDNDKCVELARANDNKRGFTYTHYDVLNNWGNRVTVNMMNHLGFTVNLSANNLDHADQLCDLNIAPVATVLPIDQTTNTWTAKGRKVVVCPAIYKDDISCTDCMLCEKRERKVVIGFPAHGTAKRKASVVASN